MGDRRSSSQIFREKALGDRHQAARQPQRSRDGISRIASARIGEQTVYAPAMCGRFTQNLSWAEIHRLAGLIGQPRNLAPRFNIAPTTPIEVIRAAAAGNELVPMYWGTFPHGGKSRSRSFPRHSTPGPRRSPSGQCFAARPNIVAASFRLRAFTNGRVRKGRRRRAISRRATAARWGNGSV